MTDKQTFHGNWHLPLLGENSVGGILSFDPDDGGSLELFEKFASWDPFDFPDGVDVIQGMTVDGKEITLLECLFTSIRTVGLGSDSKTQVKCVVRFILIGVHVDTFEHLKFNKIMASIHNLAEWVGVTGLNIQEEILDDRGITVNYLVPENISFEIDQFTQGNLTFDRQNISRNRTPFEINLVHTTWLGNQL